MPKDWFFQALYNAPLPSLADLLGYESFLLRYVQVEGSKTASNSSAQPV